MSVKGDLEDVIRRELDDCERALRRGDTKQALSELDDATRKLKEIVRKVGNLEIAARKS